MEGDSKDTRRYTENAALNVDLFRISFLSSIDLDKWNFDEFAALKFN